MALRIINKFASNSPDIPTEKKDDTTNTSKEFDMALEIEKDPSKLKGLSFKDLRNVNRWRPDIIKNLTDISLIENSLKSKHELGISLDKKTQMRIVHHNPNLIEALLRPDIEIQKYVVEKNPETVLKINKPDISALSIAVEKVPLLVNKLTNVPKEIWEIVVDAIRKDQKLFDKITLPDNLKIKLHREIMEKSPEKVFNIDPSDIKNIVKTPADLKRIMRYVKNPSRELQMEVIKDDPLNLKYIKEPDANVQMKAYMDAIHSGNESKIQEFAESIETLSPDIQDKIFSHNWTYAVLIKNPSQSISRKTEQLTHLLDSLEEGSEKEKDPERKKQLKKYYDELLEGNNSHLREINDLISK